MSPTLVGAGPRSARGAIGNRPVGGAAELPTVALIVLLAIAFVLLMLAGRHLTFFFDEWDFVLHRRGGSLGSYLDPHNGHLVLFAVVIYKALLATVGLRHYWPYQAITIVLHLGCVSLLYLLARRRVGPWAALGPAALLLFMGSAYQDLLWPFQMGWFASVAGGLGALALIERPRRRSDVWSVVLLVVSLSGSAVGVAFLIAALVLVLCDSRRWSRLWVIAVPAVLFAIWYVGWGAGQRLTSYALLAAPQYVADAAAGAAAGLAGLTSGWGSTVLLGLLLLLVAGLRPRVDPLPRLGLAAAIGALVFWVLLAVARSDYGDPTSSRYLYVGAVFILLLGAEARLGVGLRGAALAGAIVLVVGAVVANVGDLRAGERSYRAVDTAVRASLTSVQLAAPFVSPTFAPDPSGAPQIQAGPYLRTERQIGSPALTLPELEHAAAATRDHSDQVLEQAEGIASVAASTLPRTATTPIRVEAAAGGRMHTVGRCRRFATTAALGSVDIEIGPNQMLYVRSVTAPASVYLRRFGPDFGVAPFASLPASTVHRIPFRADDAPSVRWHAQVVSAGPFEICATG